MNTDDLQASSVLAWITLNRFVNESLRPIEFEKHRFLIQYMADQAKVKVTKKAAQIGLTVAETLDNFHLAGYHNMNVIHTLQTKDVIKGFVFPKVNPIIVNNPAIKRMVTLDSEGLKQVGTAFVYYRGANAESQAINISADVLKIDEYDRSNPQVVAMYPSRLDASTYAWKRYFSNPSMVGFGVDGLYNDSNQFHWFIKCHHCNHQTWIDYYPSDDKNHYVDEDKAIYACGKCGGELSDADRQNGEWVAKWLSREVHGYWFSQLMAPWKPAAEIIAKKNTEPIDIFHNMTLGKAYTPSDMVVNRETILRATAPSIIGKTGVAMGVDQDAGGQYYILMTTQGIFAHGYAKSWEEIEHYKLMYNATLVIDPNPYSTYPKQLAKKYRDVYLCYFKEMKGLEIVEWNGSTVYADRTRILDLVANEITNATILFREHPYQLEDVIAHWQNIYRTTEEKEDGRVKSTWLKKDNKQSDYPFAHLYARLALSRNLGGLSAFTEPTVSRNTPITDVAVNEGQIQTDMKRMLNETFEAME